jgi:hypothetical protein
MKDQQPPQTTQVTPQTTGPETTGQDFGSNQTQQGLVQGGDGSTELTTEQKVQAVVDKLGTNIGTNPLRQEYMETVKGLTDQVSTLRQEGKSDEDIARQMHQARIDIGKQYKELTPGPLREYIFEVNTNRYGNEYGPPIEFLLEKYKGDWNKIIEGACSPNENIDRLLAGFKGWLTGKDSNYVNAAHAEWCR